MARIKATPQDSSEQGPVRVAFEEFLSALPDDALITTGLARLSSYLEPHIITPESISAPPFSGDLQAMVEDVRRRHGPGRYKLYLRSTLGTGDKKLWSHEFMVGSEPGLAPAPGGPEAPAAGPDPLDEVFQKLSEAADAKTKAIKLSALQTLTADAPPAPAPAVENPVDRMREMLELARLLQPQPLDPLLMLKTAKDILAPEGVDTLTAIEKAASIFEKFAGAGGGGGERAGASGWDFAIELLRQVGPNLPIVAQLLPALLAQRAVAPAAPGAPIGDLTPAGPPLVAQNPPAAALQPIPSTGPLGASAAVLAAVDGDPAKAARLQWFLDACYYEMATPEADRADSFDRAAELCALHCPGFAQQLAALSPDEAWQLYMTLDARALTVSAAGPWVRGFVAALKSPPEE